MLQWWFALGGVELANSARLDAYLRNAADSANVEAVQTCGCPTLTPALLGETGDYDSPDVDPAPWYDPALPQSAEFLGLLVQDVSGIGVQQTTRTVTQGVTGVSFGRARPQPATITVTAVVVATSCCGADYGLSWLSQALAGCDPDHCDGTDLNLIACCPPEDMTPDEAWTRFLRTLRRVAVTDGPHILDRVGDGCQPDGDCSTGADAITVEWTMTAAVPWRWADPTPLLDVALPRDTGDGCVTWCVHDSHLDPPSPPTCIELGEQGCAVGVEFGCDDCPPGLTSWSDGDVCPGEDPPTPAPCDLPCRLAHCPDNSLACTDPGCRTPHPPSPPSPQSCYCVPLVVVDDVYEIDYVDQPDWFAATPMITVEAGSEDLHRVTVSFFRHSSPDHDGMSCRDVVTAQRCDPHAVFHVGYLPAGGRMDFDGQVGRVSVTCNGATETATDAWGAGGAPVVFPPMDCGTWCVLVETDALMPPAPDSRLYVSMSGREY